MTGPGAWRGAAALRGVVHDSPRTYLLGPGLNRIGSRLDGDVVLAAPGISRRHALLAVEPGGMSLEDLGSKNGTFVNGARIESARVEPGDRLRFGPVSLQLERLDEPDSELAIAWPAGPAGAAPALPESTQAAAGAQNVLRDGGIGWLAAFAATLPRVAGGSPAAALAFLARQLGARGAALLEAPARGAPWVLACTGEPAAPEILHAPFTAAGSAALPGGAAAAVHPAGSGARRGLVVWGDFPGQEHCAPLLGLALGLFDLALRPEPAAPPTARPRLTVPEGWIAGDSPAVRTLLRQMEAVAASELPILILGETGAGKEGVARILHLSSPRRTGPFVAVNCAAIPRDLLEAELFGVGRGAATGVSPRPGRFQAAAGGTLLLDEIGDLPPELQPKLLRALQEKEVQPLGSAPAAVDVRVLAATNAGLEERVAAGAFRSDLFYRLAGYVLSVPPLRERREDIPGLVEHFLRAASREAGKSIRGITVGALNRLVTRSWPGNVRQLEHEVRRLVWLAADSETVVAETLDLTASPARGPQSPAEPAGDLDLAALERRAVAEALRRAGGNQSRAAALLGLSRTALYRRMRRLSLY